MLCNNVDQYIEAMESKVGATKRSLIVRADKLDIWYNMKTMEGLADDFKNVVVGMNYPVQATEDEETKQIRLRAERNYQKLENLRKNTLVSLSDYIKGKMKDVWDIYDTYIVPFEETDNVYRKKINAIYETRTSEEDKKSNDWDFSGSWRHFLQNFALAFVITLALVLAPAWLPIGIIAALAVGSVIMISVPKQYVPSWLQRAKDAADDMAELLVRALDEGPLVYVEAIG